MKPAADLTPIEDLDRNILTLCSHINAATYELLVLIREFDERAGWLKWGLKNCAEWLAWRCDFSMTTALEKVRVAHALKTLPGISGEFASGELSYSKVRALTRVASRANEDELLVFALRSTAAHVAERCSELRCGSEDSIDSAARAYANRSLPSLAAITEGFCTVTTSNTGREVVKPVSITSCCYARGTTRWCMKEDFESRKIFRTDGPSSGPMALRYLSSVTAPRT